MFHVLNKLGSLNKASNELNMSYSKAWNIVNRAETLLGYSLLMTNTGGVSGGGNNVVQLEAKGSIGKSEVSIEQVLAWNPDIIISWGDERGGYFSQILKDPKWKDIKAVKDKEVYEIPNKPFNW